MGGASAPLLKGTPCLTVAIGGKNARFALFAIAGVDAVLRGIQKACFPAICAGASSSVLGYLKGTRLPSVRFAPRCNPLERGGARVAAGPAALGTDRQPPRDML